MTLEVPQEFVDKITFTEHKMITAELEVNGKTFGSMQVIPNIDPGYINFVEVAKTQLAREIYHKIQMGNHDEDL